MNEVVGLTDLPHCIFPPRSLQGTGFFLNITVKLWKHLSGKMKQTIFVVYRTAQYSVIKETTFLSWRLRVEQKDVTGVQTSCGQQSFSTAGTNAQEPGTPVREKQIRSDQELVRYEALQAAYYPGLGERLERDNSISGSQNIFFYPVANLQGRKLKQSHLPNLGQGYFPYFCRNLLLMRHERNQGRQAESNSVYGPFSTWWAAYFLLVLL